MRIAVVPFDPAGHAEALRECLVEHQDFHRHLEPSWPDGASIVEAYVAFLEKECAAHNGRILMADCDGQAAGFICILASTRGEAPDDPALYAWIQELYVKAPYRRSGVASRLMAEAERFARSQGATRLRLGVLDRNEGARRLYARHGYREHAHVLTKDL